MQGATIHIRLFGLVYNNPKQGDVPCGIDVRIHIVPAICTLERLVVPDAEVMAVAASLRSIGWFNDNQLNTGKSAFVCQESTELSEIPSVELAPESLVPTLSSLTDMTKVFDSETDTSVLCLGNNLFGNSVVDDRCSGLFSPAKPFQESLATSCAFGLNGATNSQSLFPILIQGIRRIDLSFGSTNDVCDTEVETDDVIRNIYFRFGYINSLIQEELAFLEYKVGFSLEVWDICFVVADERNLLATANCPYGSFLSFIGKDSCIVADAAVSSELPFLFLVQLIRIGNFADTSDNHLCGEIELLANVVITKMMDFVLAESLVLPSYIGNVGTSLVCFLYRLEKKQPLLVTRENLYFQDQFHTANVLRLFCLTYFLKTKKRNAAQFRPLS